MKKRLSVTLEHGEELEATAREYNVSPTRFLNRLWEFYWVTMIQGRTTEPTTEHTAKRPRRTRAEMDADAAPSERSRVAELDELLGG